MSISDCKKWSPQIYEVPLIDLPDESAGPEAVAEPMIADEEPEPTPESEYRVKSIIEHKWRNGFKFLVWWEGFPPDQATWEPPKHFVSPNGAVNLHFKNYCLNNGLEAVLRRALGSQPDL